MNISKIAAELSKVQLLGIGESTHGTYEFFNFKSELFKELVKNQGFNSLLMEDSTLACIAINKYISSGKGNLSDLMKEMYSVWQVEELKSLLLWMRENYDKYKLEFVGFDVNQTNEKIKQRDELMANQIITYTNTNSNKKALIWAHNSHLQFTASNLNDQPMGIFLKKYFGMNYYSIAQLFGRGRFSATALKLSGSPENDRTLDIITVDSIPTYIAETILDDINSNPYFLNKTQLSKIDFENLNSIRSIGWGLVPELVNEMTEETDLSKSFDGIVYFPTASNSHPLTK